MLINLLKTYKWRLFLLISVIFGYWQLSFMFKIMKWDMLSQSLPWRYYIGECLSNGYLPFWNHHQFLGYPIHADPQSAAWYPLTWLFGGLFGYNFYIINLEFLLHIFIGGLGIQSLGKTLNLNTKTSFLISISYVFCGIFIGNAQHLSWIVSAAWIPFVFLAFIKLFENPSKKNAIKASLFTFLLLTGGYSGFFIIVFYIIFIYTIYRIIKYIKTKGYSSLVHLTKHIGIMILSFLILSAGFIISIIKVLPHFSRGSAVSMEQALLYPFPLKAFISFLFPYAVSTDIDFWGTGLSMANGYFGIINLLFLSLLFLASKNKKPLFLFVCGVFFLLISMGEATPLRLILYNHVPGMNLLKYPSIFRYFAIFCFILSSGHLFNFFLENFELYKQKVLKVLIFTVVLIVLIVIFNCFKISIDDIKKSFEFLLKMKLDVDGSISSNIIIQGSFQLFVLIGLILLMLRCKSTKILIIAIIFIGTIEMMLATQLNMGATVISNRNFKAAQLGFNKLKRGFDITNFKNTPINLAVKEKSNALDIPGLYHNLNIFDKQIGFNGNNPFLLKNYSKATSYNYFETLLNNKVLYLSDTILPLEKINTSEYRKTNLLFFDWDNFKTLSQFSFKSNINDSLDVTSITPNNITAATHTSNQQLIVLLQNNYSGWEVFINNDKVKHFTANGSFITAVLPAGKNTIEFRYNPKVEKFSFYISALYLLAILTFLIFIPSKTNHLKE